MTEYLCLTLTGHPGESEAAFKARLTAFWTHLIRNHPDEYAKVYAEATAFGTTDGRPTRQYMVEADAVPAVESELRAAGLDCLPVDADDVYSKYEASSPDWFQIEH